MSELTLVLKEIRDNGAATSRDLAQALGWPVKKVSTYCLRLHAQGRVTRGEYADEKRCGRPAIIWWPIDHKMLY